MFKRKDYYRVLQQDSKGFTLPEVLIALGILGIISISFLAALSTASNATRIADKRATAESLARSQMEYVKNEAYDPNDPKLSQLSYEQDYESVPGYPGYEIKVEAERLDPRGDGTENDDGMQEITVFVKFSDQEVIVLEDYKVDR